MLKPKISIIINSYNYQNYVAQAIESAIAQDYPNKEIIVVDDGSTDNSKDVILSYRDKITPIFHKNLGQVRTCLRAASSATGDFIHFLDSDDFLLPGAVTAIAEVCTPDVAKVQFQLLPVGPRGETIGEPWPPMASATRETLIELIGRRGTYVTPPTSGNIYRADVLRYIKDVDYEISVDGIPYLLAPFLGEVRQIARPLGCYRYHSRSFSGHGKLDASRFRLESRRHCARLAHLLDIGHENGLTMPVMSDPEDHAFVHTRNMIVDISEGRRPGVTDYYRYSRAIMREEKLSGRVVRLLLWGLGAALGPDGLRRRLAIYRTDPRARTRARQADTTVHGQGAPSPELPVASPRRGKWAFPRLKAHPR